MIWIYNSRIAATFAVVVLHVAAGVVRGNVIGSEYWWIGNVYESMVRWCVPVFVAISGVLLLDPSKKDDLFTFYRKRCSRILPPVLFWSAFYLLGSFCMGTIKGSPPTAMELVYGALSGRPFYHMWFLYMILVLYLFTPFFRKVTMNSTIHELTFLVIVLFVFAAINSAHERFVSSPSDLFLNWFLSYTPYFFLGHLVGKINCKESRISLFVLAFTTCCILTFMGYFLLGNISGLAKGTYFYDYLGITVIPMSISVVYLLSRWTSPIVNERITRRISGLTLGVYLIHPIVLAFIYYTKLGPNSCNPLISVPATATVVFATSLAGTWLIQRIPCLDRTV